MDTIELKCTCDPGHICDGNRGHYAGGCPANCPIHAEEYLTARRQRLAEYLADLIAKRNGENCS